MALTSFNRDLMVTIADTGDIGMINSAYSRPDGTGAQNLINTIGQNFDIAINHFIAVDFRASSRWSAPSAASTCFPYPLRDKKSGLYQYDVPACVTLNGEQGLAFARSGYFQYMTSAPLGVRRVRRPGPGPAPADLPPAALGKALSQVSRSPLRLPELVDIE